MGAGRVRRWRTPLLAVAAVTGLALGYWDALDATTATAPDALLAEFRALPAAARADAAGEPTAGVYTYATTGSEQIDLLGGIGRRYPDRTDLVVTREACGTTWDWRPVAERRERWTTCPGDGGRVRLVEVRSLHEFAGRADDRTSSCEPTATALPASREPGTRFEARCASAATAVSGATTLRLDGEVVGVVDVEVAGSVRAAVHVVLERTVAGASVGRGTTERWVDVGTGLLLRERHRLETTSQSILGAVVTVEEYELVLVDPVPRR